MLTRKLLYDLFRKAEGSIDTYLFKVSFSTGRPDEAPLEAAPFLTFPRKRGQGLARASMGLGA